MRTTTGYAAVTADGSFLQLSESPSHIGYRISWTKTTDIEQATLFSYPRLHGHSCRYIEPPEPVTMVPVEIRREVILKGYGPISASPKKEIA